MAQNTLAVLNADTGAANVAAYMNAANQITGNLNSFRDRALQNYKLQKEEDLLAREQARQDKIDARIEQEYNQKQATNDLISKMAATVGQEQASKEEIAKMMPVREQLGATQVLGKDEAAQYKALSDALQSGNITADKEAEYDKLHAKAQTAMNQAVAKSVMPELAASRNYNVVGQKEALDQMISEAAASGQSLDMASLMSMKQSLLSPYQEQAKEARLNKSAEILTEYEKAKPGKDRDTVLKRAAGMGLDMGAIQKEARDIKQFEEKTKLEKKHIEAIIRGQDIQERMEKARLEAPITQKKELDMLIAANSTVGPDKKLVLNPGVSVANLTNQVLGYTTNKGIADVDKEALSLISGDALGTGDSTAAGNYIAKLTADKPWLTPAMLKQIILGGLDYDSYLGAKDNYLNTTKADEIVAKFEKTRPANAISKITSK